MSKIEQSLLLRLGDDWHNPRPFLDYIESILPSTSNLKSIQEQLLFLYEDEFYDFKSLKYNYKDTLYDVEICTFEREKKKIEELWTQEEDVFKRTCQKFESLSGAANEKEESGEEEEVEEEDDYVDYSVKKSVQTDTSIKAKQTKESASDVKKRQAREAQMIKTLKSSMATSQEKLMTLQKEMDNLDIKIKYYGHYRDAEAYFQSMKRNFILDYSKEKNLEAFIKAIDDAISYRDMMRKRYVPNDPCSRGEKGLCAIHFLPLHITKWSEKGDPLSFKCSL